VGTAWEGEEITWADERAPKLFGNDNSFGGSGIPRLGGDSAQGRNVAIIGSFRRTPGTRENGGHPSKMRGSLPGVAQPSAN
jgi:hypothetical protein